MAVAQSPIQVKLPDGSSIYSTHTCHINLPGLPEAATLAHIFPGLANHALISIGQLCDNQCEATFTNTHVTITRDNVKLFSGPRDTNGLWRIHLPSVPPQPLLPQANLAITGPTPIRNSIRCQANVAITSSTTSDLMTFLHASLFSPVPSILLKSIRNGTALVALSSFSSQQSMTTAVTNASVGQLMDYFATLPDAALKFFASDMILKIHSDAGYLNETKARSRAGGHFFLGNKPDKPEVNNGAVLNPTGILKHIASSATEAEVGALFINTKEGEIVRTTLAEMGFPQPATPVTTNISTANGIMNDTIRRQGSRAIDMRYHWVRDRVVQKHYDIFWEAGSKNLGDYFTKHHAPIHHQNMRPAYLAQALYSLSPSAL
jgi:hypothetical protein